MFRLPTKKSRIAFPALIVFVILLCLSPLALSSVRGLFSNDPDSQFSRSRISSELSGDNGEAARQAREIATAETEPCFYSVPSDPSLDPVDGKTWIVSFFVRFSQLPPLGKRQKLVVKYEREKSPYPGWAVALRRTPTSSRPEVYWQDPDGKGGWFSFDSYNFSPGVWYHLVLVARPGGYVGLAVQDLSRAESALPVLDASEDLSRLPVRYLGGFPIAGLGLPMSSGRLDAGARAGRGSTLAAEIAELFIGRSDKIPQDREGLLRAVSGGAFSLAKLVDRSDLSLWIDERGKDKSPFARVLF